MLRSVLWRDINLRVGHMCHSPRQGEFICDREQVVNGLKIPQGLSTPMFRRWSEFPLRGGVRGDSPEEKRPVSQRRG